MAAPPCVQEMHARAADYATAVDDGAASAGDAHKGSAGDAHKRSAGDAHNIKSSVSDPQGAKTDDDRGSTTTPNRPQALTVRADTLDEIVRVVPSVTNRDEAAEFAATCSDDHRRASPTGTSTVMSEVDTIAKDIAARRVADARTAKAVADAERAALDAAEQVEQQRRQQHQDKAERERKLSEYRARLAAEKIEPDRLENERRARLGLPLLTAS